MEEHGPASLQAFVEHGVRLGVFDAVNLEIAAEEALAKEEAKKGLPIRGVEAVPCQRERECEYA